MQGVYQPGIRGETIKPFLLIAKRLSQKKE